jgi:hypothetical protein
MLYDWMKNKISEIDALGYDIIIDDHDHHDDDHDYYIKIDLVNSNGQKICGLDAIAFRNDDEYLEVKTTGCKTPYRGKGYGALVYTIAIILATSKGMWIMSDRMRTSKMALPVWRFWNSHPEYFDILQLDINNKIDSSLFDEWLDNGLDEDDFEDLEDDSKNWVFKNGSLKDTQESFYAYYSNGINLSLSDFQRFWENPDAIELVLANPITKAYRIKDWQSYQELLNSQTR